jgi:hypothetical protein
VQAAIGWVLQQEGITCALVGPSSIRHLEENLGGSGWRFEEEDLQDLEQLLLREQVYLEVEQRRSIYNILTGELAAEASQAFTDMVYVLETAYCLGLASEAQIMPFFYELMANKGNLYESETQEKMALLQKKIKETILKEDFLLDE